MKITEYILLKTNKNLNITLARDSLHRALVHHNSKYIFYYQCSKLSYIHHNFKYYINFYYLDLTKDIHLTSSNYHATFKSSTFKDPRSSLQLQYYYFPEPALARFLSEPNKLQVICEEHLSQVSNLWECVVFFIFPWSNPQT